MTKTSRLSILLAGMIYWGRNMTARAKRKKINKRDIFVRIVSLFLALLIVGGTLMTIIL